MKLFPHFTGNKELSRFIYNEAGPSGSNDTGPLKVEHLKDITDEQKTDAEIHAALAKFNAKFQDQDFDLVLKYLDEVDEGDLTAADVSRLEEYAAQVEAKLAASNTTDDLGLGLATVPANDSGDLGLGLAPVDGGAVDDLGLGLAAVPADGGNDLGLGLAGDEVKEPAEPVVETVNFEPNEARCQAWAETELEGFSEYPAEARSLVMARLVRFEEDDACPIERVDQALVKNKCGQILADFEKTIADTAAEELNLERSQEAEQVKAEADEKSQEALSELNDLIGQNSLKKPQIDSLLSKINSVDSDELQKPEWKNVRDAQRQLLTVQSDLESVSNIAPADNPQEAELIQSIVTSTPVTWKAEQPTVRYASIIQQINAGQLSDDTKRRAIEALGVRFTPAPSPGSLSTGSNVNDALANGRGTERVDTGRTERVPDPDNPGQFIERPIYEDRPIPYTAEEPLEVREGVNAYPAENGDFIMTAQMPDGRVLRFNVGSDNINGEDIGRKINTAIVSMAFARKGNANINQQGLVADQGGQVIDINDIAFGAASQFSQNVMKHFVGGIAGRDGEILSSSDIKKVDRVAQWLSQEKGDFFGGEDGGHGRNDFTPAAPYLQQIGLINEDGSIGSEENFALIGAYVQPKIGTGNPDYNAVLQYYRSEKGIE